MRAKINISGKSFGKWTVLNKSKYENNHQYWTCRCDCGTVRDVRQYSLICGRSTSCGCKSKKASVAHKSSCSHQNGARFDLTGLRFGSWSVLRRGENIGTKRGWLCRCDCGTIRTLPTDRLKNGLSRSCGCKASLYQKEKRIREDLAGNRYGRLTAISLADDGRGGGARWLCKCDCGNETIVSMKNLKSGNTKSCGCLYDESIREISKTHGGSATKLYHIWSNMRRKQQKGENVEICAEWSDFSVFRDWAYKNGYKEVEGNSPLSLVRRNEHEPYSPHNCTFGQRFKVYTINGETKNVSEWADYYSINKDTVFSRLRAGLSIEEALTIPVRKRRKKKHYFGKGIDYYEYMCSEDWVAKRQERMIFDGFKCTMCGDTNMLQVHHLTYERLGHEDMDDLITVCKKCHAKIHENDLKNKKGDHHEQHD